jgi:hypothetical protein
LTDTGDDRTEYRSRPTEKVRAELEADRGAAVVNVTREPDRVGPLALE